MIFTNSDPGTKRATPENIAKLKGCDEIQRYEEIGWYCAMGFKGNRLEIALHFNSHEEREMALDPQGYMKRMRKDGKRGYNPYDPYGYEDSKYGRARDGNAIDSDGLPIEDDAEEEVDPDSHEFEGRVFRFSVVDGDVLVSTEGHEPAPALWQAGGDRVEPGDLDDRGALDAACETYCLAAGIEPLDEGADDEPEAGAYGSGP